MMPSRREGPSNLELRIKRIALLGWLIFLISLSSDKSLWVYANWWFSWWEIGFLKTCLAFRHLISFFLRLLYAIVTPIGFVFLDELVLCLNMGLVSWWECLEFWNFLSFSSFALFDFEMGYGIVTNWVLNSFLGLHKLCLIISFNCVYYHIGFGVIGWSLFSIKFRTFVVIFCYLGPFCI